MSSAYPRWHFDRQPTTDIAGLVNIYKAKEFFSPNRSTVPLLSLIRNGQSVLDQTLSHCGMPPDPALHLEFTVRPPRGNGKPSHTDLMALDGDDALAIEAKWTEPAYPITGEWLQRRRDIPPAALPARPDNLREVLAGWLDLLQRFATKPLAIEAAAGITYQTIHRAASTCAAAKRPRLAYLQFGPWPGGAAADAQHRLEDLRRLQEFLARPDGFPFYLIEIDLRPTPAFQRIALLPKGTPDTGHAVRAALLQEILFEFDPPRVTLIA